MAEHKQLGVGISPGQRRIQTGHKSKVEYGKPNTVLHAHKLEFVAMTYTDKKGKGTQTRLGVMVNGVLMEDPKGEAWAQSLSEQLPWLQKGVEQKLAAEAGKVKPPATDTVDIIEATDGKS